MNVVKVLTETIWNGHKAIFLTFLLNHLQIVQLSKLDIVWNKEQWWVAWRNICNNKKWLCISKLSVYKLFCERIKVRDQHVQEESGDEIGVILCSWLSDSIFSVYGQLGKLMLYYLWPSVLNELS